MKKFFKQRLPAVSEIKSHPNLQFFGTLLHDPNLWHLNRRSLAGGTAVGLFLAFLPLPIQMLSAAALAILFRVNLPISVSLVWLTNPLTIPPAFYFAYKVGAAVLNEPIQTIEFSASQEWLSQTLGHVWEPLLLGCLIVGTVSALIGYFTISFLWRIQVGRLWHTRRKRRLKKLLKSKQIGT